MHLLQSPLFRAFLLLIVILLFGVIGFYLVVPGVSFFDLVLINTLLPIRFAYSRYLGNSGEEELFQWAQKTPKEKNRITSIFSSFCVPNTHAVHSQALSHLYKSYCKNHACLRCNVGFHLMKT